jgi:hypothetical protein
MIFEDRHIEEKREFYRTNDSVIRLTKEWIIKNIFWSHKSI